MSTKNPKSLNKFASGMALHAKDLNNLSDAIFHIAQKAKIGLRPRSHWESGTVLTADSLNNLLEDVEAVFNGLGLKKPKWSFGKFKNGRVLQADQLNEIVDNIQRCREGI